MPELISLFDQADSSLLCDRTRLKKNQQANPTRSKILRRVNEVTGYVERQNHVKFFLPVMAAAALTVQIKGGGRNQVMAAHDSGHLLE